MMKGFKEYLDKFSGSSGSGDYPPKLQKQKLLWLAGIIALGIVLLLIGSNNKQTQAPQPKTEIKDRAEPQFHSRSVMNQEEEILAGNLKKILIQIEGAGQLDVTVRLATSRHDRYAVNTTSSRKTTEEKDQIGGARLINENNDSGQLVLIRNGQEENPIVEEARSAQVAGVLVVAQGAKTPEIKARLFKAVQVALGIEPQKILVLPKSDP